MRQFTACILVIASILITACTPFPSRDVTLSLAAGETGAIYFNSNDAYDLVGFSSGPNIVIEGELSIPENHNGAAVIFSHGSGGPAGYIKTWEKFLMNNGYAVFNLNHFAPRKVTNTLHEQIRVTEQQMAFDILNAFELLQTHPGIDGRKIYHMGWSKGGSAGLIASLSKVQNMVFAGRNSNKIAGFIEFYPWCGLRGKLRTAAPVLILIGTDDDYTLLSQCEAFARDLRSAGSNVKIATFKGSVHGFDNWTSKVDRYNFVTVRSSSTDCTLFIDPVTLEVKSQNGNFTVSSLDKRKEFLRNCAEKGVYIGGSPQYRTRTENLVLSFLAKR